MSSGVSIQEFQLKQLMQKSKRIQQLESHKQELVQGLLQYAVPTFNDKGYRARVTLEKVGINYVV